MSHSFIHWTLNIYNKAIEAGSVTSPRNRLPIHFSNYWWAGVRNYIYITLFWFHSFSLFYVSFVTDNAKPTCFGCLNSKIYSRISSLLKLHNININILFYELNVLYIFYINIVSPYEICEFI